MRVIHVKTGDVIAKDVKVAASIWPRLVGFTFKKAPRDRDYDGIYFPNCKWVHNSFVRFSLDVVFIEKRGRVVAISRGLRPWKFSKLYFNAVHALEFVAGTVSLEVAVGDQLLLENEELK